MNWRKTTVYLALAAVLFTACTKEKECEGTISKTYDVTGFSRIVAGSVLHVHLKKSETFSIKAEGCKRDIDDLRVRLRNNGQLEIDFDRNRTRRDPVEVDINLPNLASGVFSGAAQATIDGFAGSTNRLRVVLSGASKAELNGTTAETQVELSGASVLQISGNTTQLYGNISGASELKAFDATAAEVDIAASGGSKAFVFAQNKLTADASGGSEIRYRGNPPTKEIHNSGGGKVVAD